MVNTQTIPASASAQDLISRDFTQISAEGRQIGALVADEGLSVRDFHDQERRLRRPGRSD